MKLFHRRDEPPPAALAQLDRDERVVAFADTADSVVHRYTRLWEELTQTLELAPGERYRVDAHIRRLNDLGFDVEEMEITGEPGRVRVRPALWLRRLDACRECRTLPGGPACGPPPG